MKKEFIIPDELKSEIIDLLYQVKTHAKGWMRDDAVNIIIKLEDAQKIK
jgi:hypothetical protein